MFTEKYSYETLEDELQQMNVQSELSAEAPIVKGGLKGFIQRVIRKLTHFIVVPLTAKQTLFNSSCVRGINQVKNYIRDNDCEEMKKEIDELKKEVQSLKEMLGSEILKNS